MTRRKMQPLEMRIIEPDCHCVEHRGGCPSRFGEHVLQLVEQYVPGSDGVAHWRWRAYCSCNRSRPHWNYQSDSVAYHAWLNHVRKFQ
jgi:hypothetical protein